MWQRRALSPFLETREPGRAVNMNSLLAAIAGAIMASGLAGWFWGFWWGVFAYVTSGALILLTFGIVRASRPGSVPAEASGEKSDPGSAKNNAGSPPEGLHVGREGQRRVVFGVIAGAGGKGGAIPFGHLPQAGQAWAEQEVFGSRIH